MTWWISADRSARADAVLAAVLVALLIFQVVTLDVDPGVKAAVCV